MFHLFLDVNLFVDRGIGIFGFLGLVLEVVHELLLLELVAWTIALLLHFLLLFGGGQPTYARTHPFKHGLIS
jgi:hypothetical protein